MVGLDSENSIKIASTSIPNDWLFAPSTYLIDSWTPYVEEICLPSVATETGHLEFRYQEDASAELSLTNKKIVFKISSFLRCFFLKPEYIKGQVILDLREYSPGNLSHALMIHLPIALCAKEYLISIDQGCPLLIFPAALPEYIYKIYIEIGFDVFRTDNKVIGRVCDFDLTSVVSLRGILVDVIQGSLENSDFSEKLRNRSKNLPNKIFISRKDTRCLINEGEVERMLSSYGYQKIYMEDYDILDQLAMVSLSDNIVAIHGAALGPLVFRSLFNSKQLKFVEIFSPGHMANVYRVLVNQLNGCWVGVRGKLWPKIIAQAYDFPKEIHKFAYADFEVCLLSLERALSALDSLSEG